VQVLGKLGYRLLLSGVSRWLVVSRLDGVLWKMDPARAIMRGVVRGVLSTFSPAVIFSKGTGQIVLVASRLHSRRTAFVIASAPRKTPFL
jgi:hypothetical protein